MSESATQATRRLNKEDFEKVDWLNPSDLPPSNSCSDYFLFYGNLARQTDVWPTQAVYRLLSDVCSLRFKINDAKVPFEPVFMSSRGNSPSIGDFFPLEIEAMAAYAPSIVDPHLRARIADMHWITSNYKAVKSAQLAIGAYVEGASSEKDNFVESVFRASRLARQINSLSLVQPFLSNALDHFDDNDGCYNFCQLVTCMVIAKHPKAKDMIETIQRRAQSSEKRKLWHEATQYWELLTRIAVELKLNDWKVQSQLAEAEVHIKRAFDESNSNAMVAAHHLKTGIAALRKLSGQEERCNELLANLQTLQQASMAQLISLEHKIDGTELIKHTESVINGETSLCDALLSLTEMLFLHFPKREKLLATALEHSEKYIFSNIMPSVRLTAQGKISARRSGSLDSDKSDQLSKAFELACQHFQLVAQATIDPAAKAVWSKFRPSIEELEAVIEPSTFIPNGRAYIFAKAIRLGLHGEYDLAAHLLIPQIENSLRHVLVQEGYIQTRLDKDLIQEEYLLHHFIRKPETERVFGPDLVFQIRALLCEKWGYNFRNELAHGLVDFGRGVLYPSVCVWALSVYLIFFPSLRVKWRQQTSSESVVFTVTGFDKSELTFRISLAEFSCEVSYKDQPTWEKVAWESFVDEQSKGILVAGEFTYYSDRLVAATVTQVQSLENLPKTE